MLRTDAVELLDTEDAHLVADSTKTLAELLTATEVGTRPI